LLIILAGCLAVSVARGTLASRRPVRTSTCTPGPT
jgi:hypothetical protein